MNRNEKRNLNSCSKKGLIRLINDPKYAQNKVNQFPAIIGYLARHGLPGGVTKEELMDLIYTARNELFAQLAKEHADAKEPFAYDKLGNLDANNAARVKEFLRNPVGAVCREMEAFHARKENYEVFDDPDEIQYYKNVKTNANMVAIELRASVDDKNKYEHKPELIDVVSRLTKKMPAKDADLGASLKRVNSGFFGTLFRRPSKEFSAFAESFDMFRDANKAHSGNVEDLEKKTNAYLKHVLPDLNYNKDTPREQWLSQLPKGQRKRAEFAMNVLDAIGEHKEMKPYMDNVEKAVNGKPIDPSLDQVKEAAAQKQFQQELQKDVEPIAPKKEEILIEEKQPAIEQEGLEP